MSETNRCTLRVTDACRGEGGTPLQSAQALYCVACYAACQQLCLECQDRRPSKGRLEGKLKYEYQSHAWDGTSECPRCRGPHATYRVQRECPKCHNERVLFVKPEGVKA